MLEIGVIHTRCDSVSVPGTQHAQQRAPGLPSFSWSTLGTAWRTALGTQLVHTSKQNQIYRDSADMRRCCDCLGEHGGVFGVHGDSRESV